MTAGLSELLPRWRVPEAPEVAAARQAAFKRDLAQRLASPPDLATPQELAAMLDSERLDLRAKLPAGLEDFPDLPVRLRGALGRALAMLPPPVQGRFDPFGRASAFDILYQSLGRVNGRDEIPKPMVLHSDIQGDELHLRVRLIGLGGYWWPDVAEALQILCDTGVSPHNNSRLRIPLTVVNLTHNRDVGLAASDTPFPTSVHIRFVSPLRLRTMSATQFSARTLLIAAANRVARIACWHGARLNVDWGALHMAAAHVSLAQADMVAMRWDRGSQRAQSRIPVLGLLGECRLTGNLSQYLPLLELCELLNIGSHASLGLGRISIAAYP